MNIYEAKEMFRKMNEGKKVSFDLDKNCLRKVELIYADGKPNPYHHFEYDKLKVTVEEQTPVYLPISAHRENKDWENTKQFILK